MSQKKYPHDDILVENIRNISIISHVDHGKTTLTDYLLASGGLLPDSLAGSLRALDTLPEEQRRGITIESSLATYHLQFDDTDYLINLIDTPGHVDFSGKVAESLRLIDGSIIIVDAVEGIMAQTKSVLKQAIKEKIVFILFINKIDRLITELELNVNQIQTRIKRIVGEIQNICISMHVKYSQIPNFSNGTMILGSALDGWAIDYDYVTKGNTIEDIIKQYKIGEGFSKDIKLGRVVNKAITNYFPNPIQGQKFKFPALINHDIHTSTLNRIIGCLSSEIVSILVGRQERIERNSKNSFICRVISGKVKKGDTVISSITKEKVRIINVSIFKGKSKKSVPILDAGRIGSVSFSKQLTSGDILSHNKGEALILKDISYIQDPVMAISIEPQKINQIGKLQKIVEEICQYTPGLFFELNKETGELLVQGVGSLQLDVFVNDLRLFGYEIEVSEPIILSYEIPTQETESYLEGSVIKITAGRVENMDYSEKFYYRLDDSQNNTLIVRNSISHEGIDGLIEVFKQLMKTSPFSNKKIKDLFIIIDNDIDDDIFLTYESTLIFGSKLIKKVLTDTKSIVHEPYYDIEIQLPESYLGTILQELQRINGIILDVISDRDDSVIHARISVKEAIRIADKFRHLSDGNAFWSFQNVNFLPILQ